MTNLLLTITLLTSAVPVEVTMPTRNEKIEKRAIVERYVTTITNGPTVVSMTNEVLKGYEMRRFLRTEIWTEAPLALPDPKTYPPPPYAPGSVRQP